MDASALQRLGGYLKLFDHHRGEARDAYDAVAEVYDDFAEVWDRHIARPALEHINRLVERRVVPGARILDAAAGTGERSRELLSHSRPGRVVDLDASARMLQVARGKLDDARVAFVQGDITCLPFPDDSFDAVVCTWALEILEEPRVAVEEFVRVIRPEGFVVYAFCSLPEGPVGDLLEWVAAGMPHDGGILSHLLRPGERPFHACAHSSLQRFAGGLVTVATVAKCCPITEPYLPCRRAGNDLA